MGGVNAHATGGGNSLKERTRTRTRRGWSGCSCNRIYFVVGVTRTSSTRRVADWGDASVG